jgi:chaperonin cofactor prefoldin
MTLQTQVNPTQQVRQLLDRLIEQRDLYRQLKSLSEVQAQSVREGSAEQLLGVLSERQAVIDALSRSNAELAPYRERWEALSGSADPGMRQGVREVLADIEKMLNEIVEQDDRDRAELKGVQARIGMQLNQVGQAGRAIRAYGSPNTAPKAPTFTDRQG